MITTIADTQFTIPNTPEGKFIQNDVYQEYNARKVNPNTAFWNLAGIVGVWGIGDLVFSSKNKQYGTIGIMKLLGYWIWCGISFAMANTYSIGLIFFGMFLGLVINIFVVWDAFMLKGKMADYNKAIVKDVVREVMAEHKTNPVVSELEATQEPVPTSSQPVQSQGTDDEFMKQVIALNNERVRNGFDPLPAEKLSYLKEVK